MDEHRLDVYQRDGDPFSLWVAQYPALASEVLGCIQVVQLTKGSTALVDLTAGRDAALKLRMRALEGGFEDAAVIFGRYYDAFCRALLACY
jgi:hypothetical protein